MAEPTGRWMFLKNCGDRSCLVFLQLGVWSLQCRGFGGEHRLDVGVKNLAFNWDQIQSKKSFAGDCESKKWGSGVFHSATTLLWARLQPSTAIHIVHMHTAAKSQVNTCAPPTCHGVPRTYSQA